MWASARVLLVPRPLVPLCRHASMFERVADALGISAAAKAERARRRKEKLAALASRNEEIRAELNKAPPPPRAPAPPSVCAHLTRTRAQGYFADFAEIKKNGGKRFAAPDGMAKPQASEPFPPMEATAIDGTSSLRLPLPGTVTLVLLGCRGYARPMLDAYRAHFEAKCAAERGCAVVELWLVERMFFRFMSTAFVRELRTRYPEPERQKSIICYDRADVDELKSRLGVFNSITGYAYVVDKRGRVRWQCHGPPEPGELLTLERCISELVVSKR